MELHDLFEEIESPEFRARFMIFSGFKLVRNALSRDPRVALIINAVRLTPSYVDDIGKRVLFLSAENKDSPGASFDIAIAAYLYCLYQTDQFFAKRMSEYILQLGKLWWSVDLSLYIKRNMEMFADPRKWNFRFTGDLTQTEYTSWSPHTQPLRLNESVPFIVNGKKRWNTFGHLSVISPQKTKTLVHSVS